MIAKYRSKAARFVVSTFAAATFRAAALAQTPAPSSAEMNVEDAPARYQTRVNLVLIPVVVRDSQGRAIGTLKKEDFELLDNGKAQFISRFSIETPGTPRTKPAEPAGPTQPTSSPAQPTNTPERYVAFLFDDVHLSFGDLARTREAATRLITSALAPGDRVAVYTTSGQSPQDFTDDHAGLEQSLLRLRPRPISRSTGTDCPMVSYFVADLIVNHGDTQALAAVAAEAATCLQSKTMMEAESAARSAASREFSSGEHETLVTLNAMRDVVRRIAGMPGQRTVVLASPGFLTPQSQQKKTDIVDLAIRAGVIINTLDTRGLFTTDLSGDISRPQISAQAGMRLTQYVKDEASAAGDALAEFAAGTGGLFFHNNNDLDAGLHRLAAAPEFYYLLGFSPQNLKIDGRFHATNVKLTAANKYAVFARRGYYAPKHAADPAEAAHQEIQEAIFSREEIHDINVDLHTQFFKATDTIAKVTVIARVDLKQLHFRKAEGRNRDSLTVVSALFDRNGNFVSGAEKKVEMRLLDQTLERRLASGVTLRTSFDVAPGVYLVRLVVRDTEGQLMSAQNGAVEIP